MDSVASEHDSQNTETLQWVPTGTRRTSLESLPYLGIRYGDLIIVIYKIKGNINPGCAGVWDAWIT